MVDSILSSVKKNLGLEADYTAFDPDIILFTNGVFSKLKQLGIGPENGFQIENSTPTWDAFIGTDPRWNFVKTYVYLSVRILFDPPTTSYMIDAMKTQMEEYEWRIREERESTEWVNPTETIEIEDDMVFDGGTP